MTAPDAAIRGRMAAESLMLDQGRALRPTSGYTLVDGVETLVTTTLFASPCKLQSRVVQANAVEVGARTSVVESLALHLPASTPPLSTGDLWEVTSPGPLSMVPAGRRYRIVGPFEKSIATARRYDIELVVT